MAAPQGVFQFGLTHPFLPMANIHRRDFSRLLLGGPGVCMAQTAVTPPSGQDHSPLASLDLPRMREQYRKDLFQDYLAFHDRYVIDHENGGFMCSVRPNGERVSAEKRVWFE